MKGLSCWLCAVVLAGLFSCGNGHENDPVDPEIPDEDPVVPVWEEPIDWIEDFGDETVNNLSYSPDACGDYQIGDYKSTVLYKRCGMVMDCPEDVYNYPVYPGTEEWAEIESGPEMREACQVPADTVKRLSTQALIQALWEHPVALIGMIDFAPFNYQHTFNLEFPHLNAYNELCTRPDAAASLVERLKTVNPVLSPFAHCFDLIEILLAQEVFISQLDTEARITVIRYAIKKDQLRRQEKEKSFLSNQPFMCLMLGRILLNADYRPFVEEVNRNERLKEYLTLPSYVYSPGAQGNIPRTIVQHAMTYTQIHTN